MPRTDITHQIPTLSHAFVVVYGELARLRKKLYQVYKARRLVRENTKQKRPIKNAESYNGLNNTYLECVDDKGLLG